MHSDKRPYRSFYLEEEIFISLHYLQSPSILFLFISKTLLTKIRSNANSELFERKKSKGSVLAAMFLCYILCYTSKLLIEFVDAKTKR